MSVDRRFPEHCSYNKREKQIHEKLSRDRNVVKEIVTRTLLELADGGEWRTLKRAMGMLEQNANSIITLRSRYEELKKSLEQIFMDLQDTRRQCIQHLRKGDLKVAFLRDIIKDSVMNARIQLNYAEKWTCARAESLELSMSVRHAPALRADHEDCVHAELLRAYELQIKEREDLLEYWKLRYSKDTADIDGKVKEKCEKLSVTVARRGEMEKLYALHEGEMRAWLTFKRERAARLAREQRLRNAATRVQSWWRGVMVRRALGTFRYLKNVKKSAVKPKKK